MAVGELIVNLVDQAGSAGSAASAADTIIQSADTANFELVNNVGQIIASVTGIFPILAPIGLQTNVLAGTMTFLKIVVDVKDGKSIQPGDVLNLVGNVAGIVATITVLAGVAPHVTLVASGVAVASAVAGVITADGGLVDWTRNQIQNWWPQQPILNLNEFWMDIYGQARRYQDLLADPNSGFKMITITGASWSEGKAPTPPPRINEPEAVDGDGQL